jgi:hypothetical protein
MLDNQLVALAPGRVIPLRVNKAGADGGRGLWLIEQVPPFLKATGTRVVVLPRALRSKADWAPFVKAATDWPSILFLVAADDLRQAPGHDCTTATGLPGADVPPSTLGLANVLVVASLKSDSLPCLEHTYAWSKPDAIIAPPQALREAPGAANTPPRTAAEAAMMAAGLIPMYALDLKRARSAADAKRVLLGKAVSITGLAVPVLECCDGVAR